MKALLYIFASFLLFAGCSNPEYVLEEVDNPPFRPNVEFLGYEDLTHPGFQHLGQRV